jgi:hypothetical protein
LVVFPRWWGGATKSYREASDREKWFGGWFAVAMGVGLLAMMTVVFVSRLT